MEGDGTKKLSVKMFGGFKAFYGKEALAFGKQINSKYGQLFQMLMTRPGKDFSKRQVMENLYGQDTVEDMNASLNNTIFRLRKYLRESPLPAAEYLVVSEGLIRFVEAVPVESDVWMFEAMTEQLGKEKDRQKRMEICKEACALYEGEFLPQLANETWVAHKSRRYRKHYTYILRYLLKQLKADRDYREIGELAADAAAIHPFEEWEVWQIESLIARGRQRDAIEFYQRTADKLRGLEEMPSDKWMERFYETGKKLMMPVEVKEDLLQYLMEDELQQGSYYCNILSFLDYFRILRRISRRSGVQFCAMICTIEKVGQHSGEDITRCAKQAEKLEKTFQASLRIGDVYTKYNAVQYLLLCVGVQKEDVSQISARIDMDFQKRCAGRYRVQSQKLDENKT